MTAQVSLDKGPEPERVVMVTSTAYSSVKGSSVFIFKHEHGTWREIYEDMLPGEVIDVLSHRTNGFLDIHNPRQSLVTKYDGHRYE